MQLRQSAYAPVFQPQQHMLLRSLLECRSTACCIAAGSHRQADERVLASAPLLASISLTVALAQETSDKLQCPS